MNKTFAILALSGALALAIAAPPSEAAVIDQVKSKVDAIKVETAAIKSKSSNIQARISDVSAAVNEQVGEFDQVKAALDSLQAMKDKFAGGGFDPADLLEMIDTQELQDKLEELRQYQQDLQARLNDPNLEMFRFELLGVLEGIRELVTPVEQNDFVAAASQFAEVSPFQRLVEEAPRPVIALLKEVFEDQIQEIGFRIDAANRSKTWLVDNGILPVDRARVCNATNLLGTTAVLLFLWDHQQKVEEVQASWELLTKQMKEKEQKLEWAMPKIGIHGYFAIALPKSFVAETMMDINMRKGGFEWQIRATTNLKELVGWMRDSSDLCDIVFDG